MNARQFVVVGIFTGMLAIVSQSRAEAPALDRYGGCTAFKSKATGFFRVDKIGNRWMWITPEGNGMIALGSSLVGMQPTAWNGASKEGLSHRDYCLKKYGSLENWEKATAARFRDWGLNYTGYYPVNTLTSQNIPYVQQLVLSSGAMDPRWAVAGNIWHGQTFDFRLADVFNPALEEHAEKTMRAKAKPNDPMLLCYYPDEPDYLKGFRSNHNHLGLGILCGTMEIGCEGGEKMEKNKNKWPNFAKRTMIEALRNKYKTVAALNAAWGTQFKDFKDLEAVRYDKAQWGDWKDPQRKDHPAFRQDLDAAITMFGEQYCRVIKRAVAKVDPNHLIALHLYGDEANVPLAEGFKKAGNFDVYLQMGGPAAYDILQRPFQRISYSQANADSPLRLQGTVDRWVVTADPQGTKPDPAGQYLKIYDDKADIWFKLKNASWHLPVFLEGVEIKRTGVDKAGAGQALYSGKDPDGKGWFTMRPDNPYKAGKMSEWVAALEQLTSQGKKATYYRGSPTPLRDFKTQAERGKNWAEDVDKIINYRSEKTGEYFVIGLEKWKWMDNGWTYHLEQINFGLVTLKDNAYDGKEATRQGANPSVDWDNEDDDYGDFITPMREANRSVYERILKLQNAGK